MTDLGIWPECHLSALIKETIECDEFDLVLLENGEYAAIYPTGLLYTKLSAEEVQKRLLKKIK